jgi:hypothetical protein
MKSNLSSALLEGQLQGINHNIEKCIPKLRDLQQRLAKREKGGA